MSNQRVVLTLERISIQSGTLTTRALADVHPDVRELSVSQYRLFAIVASSRDGARITDLARQASMRPQAVTRLVQRLEAKGLVWLDRGSLPDRRAVVARTTAEGSRAWSDISRRRQELIAQAIREVDVPVDGAAVLDAIADALERQARATEDRQAAEAASDGR